MIVLPTEKIKAKVRNPRFLIFFGKPKSGKTTLAAHLENNLIVDLEGGSEFIDCLAVQARNINDLGEIANAIRQKNVMDISTNISQSITQHVWKKLRYHMLSLYIIKLQWGRVIREMYDYCRKAVAGFM